MGDEQSIPEIPLVPDPRTDEARAVVGFRAAFEGAGRRHKLGGTPDWRGREEWPLCPDCGERMTFYGQLDSIGDEVCLADVGMVYVFICFGCFETASVFQSG
ncbi:MAG: hypothetical protein ABIO70_03965 [Pseudomonadota bacterium]